MRVALNSGTFPVADRRVAPHAIARRTGNDIRLPRKSVTLECPWNLSLSRDLL